MKTAFIFFITIGFASFSWALSDRAETLNQLKTPSGASAQRGFISKGFKLSMGLANFDYQATESMDFGTSTYSDDFRAEYRSPMYSLGFGYDSIRDHRFGLSTDLLYFQGNDPIRDSRYAIAVVDLNLTYGLSSSWHLYLGGNLSRVLQGRTMRGPDGGEIQPLGVGGQLGVGFNFSPELQLTLGYHLLSQRADYQIQGKKVGEIKQTQTSLVSAFNYIF